MAKTGPGYYSSGVSPHRQPPPLSNFLAESAKRKMIHRDYCKICRSPSYVCVYTKVAALLFGKHQKTFLRGRKFSCLSCHFDKTLCAPTLFLPLALSYTAIDSSEDNLFSGPTLRALAGKKFLACEPNQCRRSKREREKCRMKLALPKTAPLFGAGGAGREKKKMMPFVFPQTLGRSSQSARKGSERDLLRSGRINKGW